MLSSHGGGKAAAFAHVDLRKNRKFMLDTIRINHQCIGHAHKDLRKDRHGKLLADAIHLISNLFTHFVLCIHADIVRF